MNPDVLGVLSFAWVDNYRHMHIVLDADVSQLGHQRVLKLELFQAFALLRQQKLKSVNYDNMNVMFFNCVNDCREDFVNVGRAVEIHQMQRQFLKFFSVVIEFLDVFGEVDVRKLIEHVSH